MPIPTFRHYTLERSLKATRERKPLVHCITNYVTVNDCANAVLACGGSPIMSDEPDEVEEITSICDALVLNIGTLNKRSIEAMKRAGRKASQLGHPIVLDPVGAGASKLRTRTAVELLRGCNITAVRGNMSEMRALDSALGDDFGAIDDSRAGDDSATSAPRGVDATPEDVVNSDNIEQSVEFARAFARKIDAIVVITGEVDVVSDPKYAYAISNGSEIAAHITGAGCMLSCVLGAYLGAYPECSLDAALSAVTGHGICGEIAERRLSGGRGCLTPGGVGQAKLDGTGTFRTKFIDALSNLDAYTIEDRALISTFELYFKIREG